MKLISQFAIGFATAVGSILLVIAALALSLTEGTPVAAILPSAVPSATHLVATATALSTTIDQATISVFVTATNTLTLLPSLTSTASADCPPPDGWVQYTVETGENLEIISKRVGVSVSQLQQANCLDNTHLIPGATIYLPPPTPTSTVPTLKWTATRAFTSTPTPRNTATFCGRPAGWTTYIVQPSDTLYRISQAFGVTVFDLMQANCLNSTLIHAGTVLYVPNVPTHTPVVRPTNTPAPTRTKTPTSRPTSQTPTNIPTQAPTRTPTQSPTTAVPPTLTPTVEIPTKPSAPTDTPIPYP